MQLYSTSLKMNKRKGKKRKRESKSLRFFQTCMQLCAPFCSFFCHSRNGIIYKLADGEAQHGMPQCLSCNFKNKLYKMHIALSADPPNLLNEAST